MAKSQWSFKTAVELSAALAAKQVSAVELAQDAIGRIERHDAKVNAVCVRDFERGLAAARAADAELARGISKPLLGIPMTVKESFNVAGLPTTYGNPAQKDFRPTEDALSITRVKDAGGVILGKTNVPIALADWQSYNEVYGTTNNPFGLDPAVALTIRALGVHAARRIKQDHDLFKLSLQPHDRVARHPPRAEWQS